MSSTRSMSKNSPLFLVPSTASTIGNRVLYVWSRRNNSRFFGSGFKFSGTDSTVAWRGRIWTRTTTDWFMIVITYTTSLLEILCKKKTVKLVFVQLTNSKQRNPNGILQTVIILVTSQNEKKQLVPLIEDLVQSKYWSDWFASRSQWLYFHAFTKNWTKYRLAPLCESDRPILGNPIPLILLSHIWNFLKLKRHPF